MVKNEYRVTWKTYKMWLLENRRKQPRLAITIMWIVLGVAAMGMGLAFRYALYFVFALFGFYRAFFRDILVANRQYDALAKSYGQKDWLRTITFDEEQIVLTEGNISVNYRYVDIIRIEEKDNRVWLMLKDKKVIRLYKDCFGDSSWEECRALIEERRRTPTHETDK